MLFQSEEPTAGSAGPGEGKGLEEFIMKLLFPEQLKIICGDGRGAQRCTFRDKREAETKVETFKDNCCTLFLK